MCNVVAPTPLRSNSCNTLSLLLTSIAKCTSEDYVRLIHNSFLMCRRECEGGRNLAAKALHIVDIIR